MNASLVYKSQTDTLQSTYHHHSAFLLSVLDLTALSLPAVVLVFDISWFWPWNTEW